MSNKSRFWMVLVIFALGSILYDGGNNPQERRREKERRRRRREELLHGATVTCYDRKEESYSGVDTLTIF